MTVFSSNKEDGFQNICRNRDSHLEGMHQWIPYNTVFIEFIIPDWYQHYQNKYFSKKLGHLWVLEIWLLFRLHNHAIVVVQCIRSIGSQAQQSVHIFYTLLKGVNKLTTTCKIGFLPQNRKYWRFVQKKLQKCSRDTSYRNKHENTL